MRDKTKASERRLFLRNGSLLLTILLTVVIGCALSAGSVSRAADQPRMVKPDDLNFQDYDIVYVIDNSGSMESQDLHRNRALRNITRLATGSDTRIGVVYFTNIATKALDISPVKTAEESEKVIGKLNTEARDGSFTHIGEGLKAALDMLEKQDSDREKLIILFSDGVNDLDGKQGKCELDEQADKETEERAQLAEKRGIPIYCVLLKKVNKGGAEDEAYLADLVNYFHKPGDDGYEDHGDRFYITTYDDIVTSFSYTFAEMFYDARNNMIYHEITFDDNGRFVFDVPDLGVKELRVFLQGKITEAVVLPGDNENLEKMTDEVDDKISSPNDPSKIIDKEDPVYFKTYPNPVLGEWSISISTEKGVEPGSVRGIIAYYTDLSAAALETTSAGGTHLKGEPYRLDLTFYDDDGNQIKIDDHARVTAKVVFYEEPGDGEPLSVSVADGAASCADVSADSYGKYHYDVQLTAGDYINLRYTLPGGSVEPTPPEVFPVSRVITSEKAAGGGQRFSFPEGKLFRDLEGDAVTVDPAVIQFSESNPVSVEQKDGYVYLTAKSPWIVDFALRVTDESGLSADIPIKGVLINKTMVYFAIIGLILGIAAVIIRKRQKKADEDARKNNRENFQTSMDQILRIYSENTPLLEEWGGGKEPGLTEKFKNMLNGFTFEPEEGEEEEQANADDIENKYALREVAAQFPQALSELDKDIFGNLDKPVDLNKELSDGFEAETLEAGNKAFSAIKAMPDRLRVLKEQAASASSKDVKEAYNEAKNMQTGIVTQLQILRGETDEVKRVVDSLIEQTIAIKKVLTSRVSCKLEITNIDGNHALSGTASGKNMRGDNREPYPLSDVRLYDGAPLGQIVPDAKNIKVYGNAIGDSRNSVLLLGGVPFSCDAGDENAAPAHSAVLEKGIHYRIVLTGSEKKHSFTVRVV